MQRGLCPKGPLSAGSPNTARWVDPKTGLVYQHREDTRAKLLVVDLQKQAVTKRYPLASDTGPTGLAFDVADTGHCYLCGGFSRPARTRDRSSP